jgi:type I restriction enzyme M protein
MISNEVKKTLWAAADKLRSNMDAAEYKHIVLGMIFLKYVSDAFTERRTEWRGASPIRKTNSNWSSCAICG